jgi:hypothetical protein
MTNSQKYKAKNAILEEEAQNLRRINREITAKLEKSKITKELRTYFKDKFPKGTSERYKDYFKRAYSKKITFEFTEEQFIERINQNCVYCGVGYSGGLDKVNPKLGYTLANTVPCCKYCNVMKYIYTPEFFKEHIAKIYHFNQKIA